LRIGVTIACFCEAGNLAEASDALTSFANIGGIVSGIDLTSHVGSGSRLHCLLGQRPRRRLMSAAVTGASPGKRQLVALMTSGCAKPAVSSRIDFTLSRKKLANISAVIWASVRAGWSRGCKNIILYAQNRKSITHVSP